MEKQMLVNCIEDNKFEQDRKVIHSCYSKIELQKENVFYIESLICDDFKIGQYYTICPNCGYIILLDENILPEEIKLSARGLKEEDPLLYRKNELKSELIYLEYITPKVKARTRINW